VSSALRRAQVLRVEPWKARKVGRSIELTNSFTSGGMLHFYHTRAILWRRSAGSSGKSSPKLSPRCQERLQLRAAYSRFTEGRGLSQTQVRKVKFCGHSCSFAYSALASFRMEMRRQAPGRGQRLLALRVRFPSPKHGPAAVSGAPALPSDSPRQCRGVENHLKRGGCNPAVRAHRVHSVPPNHTSIQCSSSLNPVVRLKRMVCGGLDWGISAASL
jgi:hypothetical protein